MSLIDKRFLKKLKLIDQIKKVQTFIAIRDIKTIKHVIDDYLMFFMYVKNLMNNQFVVAHLRRKIHVVDNLKVKFLLNMNVMNSKKMIVDMNQQKLIIKNYQKFIVKLKITTKNNVKVRRVI